MKVNNNCYLRGRGDILQEPPWSVLLLMYLQCALAGILGFYFASYGKMSTRIDFWQKFEWHVYQGNMGNVYLFPSTSIIVVLMWLGGWAILMLISQISCSHRHFPPGIKKKVHGLVSLNNSWIILLAPCIWAFVFLTYRPRHRPRFSGVEVLHTHDHVWSFIDFNRLVLFCYRSIAHVHALTAAGGLSPNSQPAVLIYVALPYCLAFSDSLDHHQKATEETCRENQYMPR